MLEKKPMHFITTLAVNLNRAGPDSESVINRQLSKLIILRPRRGSALLVLAVLVGLGFPAAATAFSGSSVLATTSPQITQISIVNGAGTTQSSLGFSPDTVTVVIGVNNTVTWTNNDNTMDANGYLPTHVLATNDSSFTSPGLNPGDTFTYTFTTPGTFPYHCNVHPWMRGTVIVKGTGTTGTTTTTSTTTTNPAPEFPLAYVVMLFALGACAIAFRLTRDRSTTLFGAKAA